MIFLIKYKLYTSRIVAKNYRTYKFISIYINCGLVYRHRYDKKRENIDIIHMHADEQYMLDSDNKKKNYYVDSFQLIDGYNNTLNVWFPERGHSGLFSIINHLSIGAKNKDFTILNIIKNVSRNQLKKIIGAHRKVVNKTRNIEEYQKTRIYVKGKFRKELMI